jgi:hypothetical protein
MHVLRSVVSVVTALAFFLQATGLAYASPPQGDVQPVPYNPSQPVPLAPQPTYAPAPAPAPVAPPAPGYASAPVYARAAAGGDAVYMKGGGVIRGTMTEMVPNDHVTIQLPTGQPAIVEWGKIDHIERAAPGVAAVTPPLVSALPAPRRHVVVEGATVIVHLEADPGVALESIAPGSGRWALVCAAPCDAQVPLGRQYRIAGEGIRASRAFRIEAPPGQRVTITVSAASKSAFSGGIALSSVGAAGIVVGLSVVLFGALEACSLVDPNTGACVGSSDGTVETVGLVITLVGAAVLVGGLIMLASNTRTHATQTLGELTAQPPRPETAWLRTPLWHESARDSGGLPKAMGVPLLSHSF